MLKILLPLLVLFLASFSNAAEVKMLKLEIPPENHSFNTLPYWPNLVGTYIPNPTPIVPAEVKNVALNKKVTSSDTSPPMGKLEQVTDGIKGEGMALAVYLRNGLQWIQIDLEESFEIFVIALWHDYFNIDSYIDVVVQVSNDPEFKTGVTTVFNADHDNSSKLGAGKDKAYIEASQGKLIILDPAIKARYVRFYSDDFSNSYVEVEVYGR